MPIGCEEPKGRVGVWEGIKGSRAAQGGTACGERMSVHGVRQARGGGGLRDALTAARAATLLLLLALLVDAAAL